MSTNKRLTCRNFRNILDTNTVSQEVTEEVKIANVKDDEEDNEHEVEAEMEDIGNVESNVEVINVAKMEPVEF